MIGRPDIQEFIMCEKALIIIVHRQLMAPTTNKTKNNNQLFALLIKFFVNCSFDSNFVAKNQCLMSFHIFIHTYIHIHIYLPSFSYMLFSLDFLFFIVFIFEQKCLLFFLFIFVPILIIIKINFYGYFNFV